MYFLVRYTSDGIFQVVSKKEVKITKKKTMARYGRYWYEAVIVSKNSKRSALEGLCYDFNFKRPCVELSRVEVEKRSSLEVSLKNIPPNTVETNLVPKVLLDGQAMNISPNTTYIIEPVSNLFIDQEDGNLDNTIQEISGILETENMPIENVTEDNDLEIDHPNKEIFIIGNEILSTDSCIKWPIHDTTLNVDYISEEMPNYEDVLKNDVAVEPSNHASDESVVDSVSETHPEDSAGDQLLYAKNLRKINAHKQHSCYFCKKVIFQLPRHWFKVHPREPEIQRIMELHKDNPQRKKMIDELRKKGDFKHNQEITNGEDIVVRKTHVTMRDYRPCPSCLGYFSKQNLRRHKNTCSPKKGDRYLQGKSIKLTKYIHPRASEMLRNQIAPDMHKDEISNNFLFDEIIIVYGNFLCIKYTEAHLKTHIRAQLRLLGRLMMQAKKIDSNIKCCKDLMHPSCVDTVRKAIDAVAGLNQESGIYAHPTNARTLSTEFKKILEVVLSESDKNEDEALRKLAKAMSRRYNLELAPYINRICKLSENRLNRLKEVSSLPENREIEEYLEFLTRGAHFHSEKLEKQYTFEDWNKLCQYLLVALAVFNRKRPGEIQRLELEEFNRRACVSEKDFMNLDDNEKIQADKYIRVAFRGKLGNTTALLIDKRTILPHLQLVVKYRQKAGVHKENPYLFGFPSIDKKYKTFDTYRCNRKFLNESNMNKSSLTFTNLRKHFATQVAKEGTSHEEELRISNYMSHKYSIHKTVYDQSTPLIDITTVSKRLESSAKNKMEVPGPSVGSKKKGVKTLKRKPVETIEWSENSSEDGENVPESDSGEEEIIKSFKGKFKSRELWSSDQKRVTRVYFRDELMNDGYIHGDKIRALKSEYKETMKNRSTPMIKQWLEGEKKKKKLESLNITVKRSRFSTPEREILEKSTERYSLEGSEPSLQELEEIINQQDVLKKRTPDSLLRKFRYMKSKSKVREEHE